MTGPLTGVTVLELVGLGPAPYAGQVLADLGAEVIAVARPGAPFADAIERRGKVSVVLDLKQPQAVDAVLRLIAQSDILLEGFRPGVTERLGLGPEVALGRNPSLVYGRMTGWGQTGPWAGMAGHDINYIGLTGALHAMGHSDRPPVPPLNLLGDFGAGAMFLVAGVLAALHAAGRSGKGDVVDAAIIDGTVSTFGMMLSLHAAGQWSVKRQANWLDGGMPYYRCYACRDGGFMAVGALEPQFFAALLQGLEIDPQDYGGQHDPARRAAQHKLLEDRFASRSRAAWEQVFDGVDACVTPVLDYIEAAAHPQMVARSVMVTDGDSMQPNRAPRLASQPAPLPLPGIAAPGRDTARILARAGVTAEDIAQLCGPEA